MAFFDRGSKRRAAIQVLVITTVLPAFVGAFLAVLFMAAEIGSRATDKATIRRGPLDILMAFAVLVGISALIGSYGVVRAGINARRGFKEQMLALYGTDEAVLLMGDLVFAADPEGYVVSSGPMTKARSWAEVSSVEWYRGNILLLLSGTKAKDVIFDVLLPPKTHASSGDGKRVFALLCQWHRDSGSPRT